MALRIALFGAQGRMGLAITALINRSEAFELSVLPHADVLIDFSSPEGCLEAIEQAHTHACALVSGTTGLTHMHHERFTQASSHIPILCSANMSVGVALLRKLVQQAAFSLAEQADIELIESHHKYKKDAPSGTANMLIKDIQKVRQHVVPQHGRHGLLTQRAPTEIGVHAIRGGNVVGEHALRFISEYEQLEISHRALSRDVFASGALQAAAWLHAQKPGYYSLEHLLNSKTPHTYGL